MSAVLLKLLSPWSIVFLFVPVSALSVPPVAASRGDRSSSCHLHEGTVASVLWGAERWASSFLLQWLPKVAVTPRSHEIAQEVRTIK